MLQEPTLPPERRILAASALLDLAAGFSDRRPDGRLHSDDVLRYRPFRALNNVELDRVTLLERAAFTVLNGRGVHEHVSPIFTLDHAEALGLVEPLDLSGRTRHVTSFREMSYRNVVVSVITRSSLSPLEPCVNELESQATDDSGRGPVRKG